MQREEFVEDFKTHLHIRMHSLTILLMLCGLLGSSLALTCWNSVGFKALRDTNVREINSGVVAANYNPGGAGDHDAGVPRDHEQVLLQEVVPRHQLGGPLLQPRLLGHRAAARDRGQEGGCGWHHCCHHVIIVIIIILQGFSGEYGDYFCSGDYCNSSRSVGALAALTLVTVLALSML